MEKKHPRFASAIFIIIYFLIGLLISGIFKVKLCENEIFICVGAGLSFIIYSILQNEYYEGEKKEEDFFKKVNKGLEDNLKNDKNE